MFVECHIQVVSSSQIALLMSLIVIKLATSSSLAYAIVVPIALALAVVAPVVKLLAVGPGRGRMVRLVFTLGLLLSGSIVNLLASIFENGGRVLHGSPGMVMNGGRRQKQKGL